MPTLLTPRFLEWQSHSNGLSGNEHLPLMELATLKGRRKETESKEASRGVLVYKCMTRG